MIETDRPVENPSGSREESDPEGLRFYSGDNALRYADKLVKDSNSWLVANNINVANRYERLNLEVVLVLRSMFEMRDYHLIFRAIPFGGKLHRNGVLHDHILDMHSADSNCAGHHDFVFLGITQLVQGPEKIIPSFVWLKSQYEVNDFLRHVGGMPFPFGLTLNLFQAVTERKMGVPCFPAVGDTDGVACLIESGTQVVNGVEGDSRKGRGHWPNQLDLMKILCAVSIVLDDAGVWATIKENANFGFKCRNVTLGMLNAVF